jgi:hypothetical protein
MSELDHFDARYFLIASMLVPFNWLSSILPQAGVYQSDVLLMPLVVALTGALMFSGLQELGYSRAVSFLTALALGIASPLLVYSKYLFREPLAALGLAWLALSVIRLDKRLSPANLLGVAGALIFSVAAKDTTISAVPGLLLCLWLIIRRHKGQAQTRLITGRRFQWALPIVIVVVVILAVWLSVQTRVGAAIISLAGSGNPLGGSLDKGLAGLLVSPGRGLFWYAPILFIAFAAFPRFYKKHSVEAVLVIAVSLASLFLHAAYPTWWGGWGWGPRFLVPIIPLWCFPLAEAFGWCAQAIKMMRSQAPRAALLRIALLGGIAIVIVLSSCIQLLGAAIPFDLYENTLEISKGHIAAMRDSGDINFIYNYSPFVIDPMLFKPANLDFVWIRARKEEDNLSVQAPLLASLAISAGWFAASAWFLLRLTRRRDLIVATCVSILAMAWSSSYLLSVAYADERYSSTNYQAAVQRLSQEALASDGFLLELPVRNWWQTVSYFLNYLQEPRLAMYALARPIGPISTVQTVGQLQPLVSRHRNLWLHVESTAPGDPANQYERWLTDHEFLLNCDWFNQHSRLCLYSINRQSNARLIELNVKVGSEIRLVRAAIDAGSDDAQSLIAHPGTDMQLTLSWSSVVTVNRPYKVFIQLMDSSGNLRQQIDREPVNAFRPTNHWAAGEEIQDRYALRLGALEPGKYRIIAGLYDAETIARLPIRDAQGKLVGDFVELTVLDVR